MSIAANLLFQYMGSMVIKGHNDKTTKLLVAVLVFYLLDPYEYLTKT
jgi:hypothetical protein